MSTSTSAAIVMVNFSISSLSPLLLIALAAIYIAQTALVQIAKRNFRAA
jgi:hypothetical protein